MKPHTVLLLLPKSIASDYGKEICHWVGPATAPTEAISLARTAFAGPVGSTESLCEPDELHVLLAAEGELKNVTREEVHPDI